MRIDAYLENIANKRKSSQNDNAIHLIYWPFDQEIID
jgi:hypothetical protein